MEPLFREDTIAAVSTAFGEGGIGIVRLSGPDALSVLKTLWDGDFCGEDRRLTLGAILDPETGQKVDEVLAVYMKAPKTYTREDVVEIHCHGSVVSLRKILSLCLTHGARLAEQGEFTKRAFLNGRLDLSQAEAVMDLISAKTDESLKVAVDQLSGRLSEAVQRLRAELLTILVEVGVNMDYPDEDIEEIVTEALIRDLTEVKRSAEALRDSASVGKVFREGLHVAIVGVPNVGKSSLLNALMGEDRAIVTDIPGTTRDEITEYIDVDGIPLRLVDTAGIRETDDTIEKIGIERSQANAARADLVLWVVDGSRPLAEEDRSLAGSLLRQKVLVLLNKQDLGTAVAEEEIRKLLPEAVCLKTSLKEGMLADISSVTAAIREMVLTGAVQQEDSVVVTNARHEALLAGSCEQLSDAIKTLSAGEALDIAEIDIRAAYETLGEILGETFKDDIIDEIFARFCLGK